MSDQISTFSGTPPTLAAKSETSALRRALPGRGVAGVAERPRRVPGDRPALAGLRVAGAVDPEIGVDHGIRGVRGRRRAEAAAGRVAPDGDPPPPRVAVVNGPAAVLGRVDHEVLPAREPRELEPVPDV